MSERDDTGEPDAFCDWRAANPEIVLDAVDKAEFYMIGRLNNDKNQAAASRVMSQHWEAAYEDYKREWEAIHE